VDSRYRQLAEARILTAPAAEADKSIDSRKAFDFRDSRDAGSGVAATSYRIDAS
jgi:hypothetical protein